MLTAKNKNKIKYIVRFLLLKLWNFRNAFQDDWSTIAHQEGRLPFAKRQLEQSKKDGDGDSQTWVSLGALLGLCQPSLDMKSKSAPCCPERPLKSELILLN